MAILKIISHGKNHAATRRILQYVLNPDKTNSDLCHVSGDYLDEEITAQSVYRNFIRVRGMFGKDGGRTYTHGTVSFAPGEITPEETDAFARELVERIYPGHQVLTVVHTDTEHCHAHFVVEPVSYLDGAMLHTSKQDLVRAKQICNEMCRERGLSVAQKGRHADGSAFAPGEVSSWDKNKYHQMIKDPKKSWMADLAAAVQECLVHSRSREDFCSHMEHEHGWMVAWRDTKKNITFTDAEGHKVRDSNLSKTFNLNLSKEALEQHFAKQTRRSGRRR